MKLILLAGNAPANTTDAVDTAMIFIVAVSAILLLGITAAMIYFVFKYHRSKGHKPVDIHGSVLLETIWIAIPTILVLAMFWFGYTGFETIREKKDDALKIKVTARMWDWTFAYENGVATDTLFIPINKPVQLDMQSADVNHSLYIPAFRVKEDVIPGRDNYLSFTPQKLGEYDIACAEYCGLNHSNMYKKAIVLTQKDYDTWYNKPNAESNETDNMEQTSTDSTNTEK